MKILRAYPFCAGAALALSGLSTYTAQASPLPVSFIEPAQTTKLPGLDIGGSGVMEDSVVTGDFNNDGHLDLLIANPFTGFAPILMLGKGDGTFAPGPAIAPSITQYFGGVLATGDFNGDGNLDFAVAGADFAFINMFLGDGKGNFKRTETNVAFQPGQTDMVVGDVNRDGKADIVLKTALGIQVYLGKGDGTFTGGLNTFTFTGRVATSTIKLANFYNSGTPDLVLTDALSQQVVAFRGNGNGTFTQTATAAVPLVPGSVEVGDFNGDGIDDVAAFPEFNIINPAPGQFLQNIAVVLTVPPAHPGGSIGFTTAKYYYGGLAPANGGVADVNGDGKLDLLSSDVLGGTIVIQLGNGDGSFTNTTNYVFPVQGAGMVPLIDAFNQTAVTGDFNGSGKQDIATVIIDTTGGLQSYLSLLINNTP
ncbi:MAG: VCBS repeat-containing protein [Nevskia sp.]|nr:VCBS repeat-containing protein [Nevskia sp.]